MAFEKAKVLKAAEKFLSQGKISAAIKEYRQIISHDDKDLTALNMLGDLLARAGQNDEAVSCFSRIAEHYREQEFTLKAIAMYKKIEKLRPRDPETAAKLADLYAAQGLVVDARSQYLVVADAYTRAGETRHTLRILHKIADLDPQNTEIRLKLARGYLEEKMQPEAVRAFIDAASRLLEKGEFEESLEAYTLAFQLRPHDKEVLRGLVSAHAALGTAEDAVELLERAVAEDRGDPELIDMLAQAYLEAGDPAGAERATAMLVAQDGTNYRLYIEVVRGYLKRGEADEAARVLGILIEPMLKGREENDLLELVNELLQREPEHVGGLRLLARIYWWQRDMEQLRAVLERMAESAETTGLIEDERYALSQLVRLAPDEPRFVARLNELGGAVEGDEASFLNEPSAEPALPLHDFAIVEPTLAEFPETGSLPVDEFEWNSVAEPVIADANASFADLNEPDIETVESEVAILHDEAAPDPAAQGFIVDASEEQLSVQAAAEAQRLKAMMRQELESVDFYISQGYSDIAVDTLKLLERQFGSHAEIDSRRQKLSGVPSRGTEQSDSSAEFFMSEPVASAEPDQQAEVVFAAPEPTPPLPDQENLPRSPAGSGIDLGLAEVFEEFRLEAEGETASTNEDFETHYNMATAYKEMELLDDAIREFQIAAGLAAPHGDTARYFQCCNMLGHSFVEKAMPRAAVLWFKKGLETPGRTSEEYTALQYELASAYEQMGDLTRAIAVFTEVYGVDVSYRDVAERLQNLQATQGTQKRKKKRN